MATDEREPASATPRRTFRGLEDLQPHFQTDRGAAYNSDALEFLRRLPSDSVDLVITSPPYPLFRPKEYGNPHPDEYWTWLRPICTQIRRVLKPTGSFVLELGGEWLPGLPVRSTHAMKVAVELSKMFHLAQDLYWFNPTRLPLSPWVNNHRTRVKDAVNPVWWFAKTAHPKADNRRVLIPYSRAHREAVQRRRAKVRTTPTGIRFGPTFCRDNGGAIPSNLLTIPNSLTHDPYLKRCRAAGIKPHPARFADGLVKFFISLLTDEGDLVVDPFAGSNVSGAACESMRRQWLACEIVTEYLEGARFRFGTSSPGAHFRREGQSGGIFLNHGDHRSSRGVKHRRKTRQGDDNNRDSKQRIDPHDPAGSTGPALSGRQAEFADRGNGAETRSGRRSR